MSAGVAHADPTFVVAESQARAGDAVHFSVTGAKGRVKYELEVADRDVLKGEADSVGGAVSGQFTMPDLGGSAKSVTVEAEVKDSDDKVTVKRKLQYLGQALPVVEKPAPAPQAAAPAAPQQAPAAPSAPAVKSPSAPAAAVKKHSKAKRRHVRKRRHATRKRNRSTSKAERQSYTRTSTRSGGATTDDTRKAKPTHRRAAPRRAPLFNGVPEPDTGGYSAADGTNVEKHRVKPPTAVVTNAVANRDGPGEPATAILIPGVLGLLGFVLAGATLVRQRRNN